MISVTCLRFYYTVSFSLNIFIYSELGNKFCNLYYSLSTLRVRVLPCNGISLLFFEIYKGVLTCKRYGSLVTRVSHLWSPSDGLSSFPRDHNRKWCQGRAENSVPEIFIPDGNRTRNLCVSSPMH